MSSPTVEPADLLDLKLLPAWLKEPAEARSYDHYTGEEERRDLRGRWDGKGKRSTPNAERSTFTSRREDLRKFKKVGRHSDSVRERSSRARRGPGHKNNRHHEDRPKVSQPIAPPVTICFLPYPPAFENVVAQIKSGSVAYSLFALARLFLEKPERYEVCLTDQA